RRSRRSGSQGAQDDLGALGALRPSCQRARASRRDDSEELARWHARGTQRLEGDGLARTVSAGGPASLFLQALRARHRAARPEEAHEGGAREGNGRPRARAWRARGALPEALTGVNEKPVAVLTAEFDAIADALAVSPPTERLSRAERDLLRWIPTGSRRGLDVGCGDGLLTRA